MGLIGPGKESSFNFIRPEEIEATALACFEWGSPMGLIGPGNVSAFNFVRPEENNASTLACFEWGSLMGLIGPGKESPSTRCGFSELDFPVELIAMYE